MSVKQIKKIIIAMRTIFRFAATKQIPSFKIGGSWRLLCPYIDSWIKQHSQWFPLSIRQGRDEPL